ncbi:MAG: hypothetical protein P8K11_00105 [Gammaproteobacteria bacterium]|nr:hypothetical protein [Gammaproteobacteria bacterium]
MSRAAETYPATTFAENGQYSSFKLPLTLTIVLAAMAFLPRVQESPRLAGSFLGASLLLLIWQLALLLYVRRTGVAKQFNILIQPQHYVQALVQFSVYIYWGYYWRPVYDHLWLLAGQVVFAFTLGILLAWSRRRTYLLGFGPIPIIFSTNLFLWFRDDWFYLQFLMIFVGFLGKEYIRWQRDGKSSHIFNPSAFGLGLFSLILIFTGTTDLTWASQISSTLTLAPNIYAYLFVAGLVVMYFFSITLVSVAAAITLFALSSFYSAATGVPYFLDSEIPAAVFLGLHLLITDPSTSPRTPLGKTIFGILYGLGVFGLYTLLDLVDQPTFYDKLLCVPLLNLSVILIDRAVRSSTSTSLTNMWNEKWLQGHANIGHMGAWVSIFIVVSLLGKTDGRHTGDSLPFWEESCANGLVNSCERLLLIEATYCNDNSAWACNELGAHYRKGEIIAYDDTVAQKYFTQACELNFSAGCINLMSEPNVTSVHAPPKELDLRLMLRQAGKNLMELSSADLLERACDHNWSMRCS